MMHDPVQSILGVPAHSDPHTLLGLSPERCTPAQIDEALRQRIGRVYQHPEGRSATGLDAVRALRRAAAQLRDPQRRPVTYDEPPSPLTDFDREVLAILIGYGGWNAPSRARLVALAAAHGVSAHGLIRIIGGLSRHARSSQRQIDISQMLSGVTRPTVLSDPSRSGPMIEMAESLVDRFAPVLRERTTRATLLLSSVFGAVALVAAIASLVLFAPRPVAMDDSEETGQSIVASSAIARHRPGDGRDSTSLNVAARPAVPLEWETLPTFAVSTSLPEAVHAAESYDSAADDLDAVARRLTINIEPAETTYQRWSTALGMGAAGWMMAGEQERLLLDRRMADVLAAAASAPGVSDRLLSSLVPASDRLSRPLEVWRGAWRAGTLGRLASHPRLPPIIIDQAGTRLDGTLDEPVPAGRLSFDSAASAWLDQIAPNLVAQLEVDDDAYAYWEMWLEAQRRVRPDRESFNAALWRAVRLILEQDADLSRPGPRQNVFGRLLAEVDYPGSDRTQQALSALFQNERVSSSNLWVLTSLLAADPRQAWFTEALVVSPNAPLSVRRRAADDIRQAWPTLSPARAALEATRERGLVVDGALRNRWNELAERVGRRSPTFDPAELMREIELAARLNEAAALLAIDAVERSEGVMRDLAAQLDQIDDASAASNSPARGSQVARQPMAQDGAWSAAYEQSRRNTEERINLLRALRAQSISDLGETDAATLVREVYRATPVEVRDAAQIVLIDKFVNGSNVAAEMVDQFPDAPRSQLTTDAIVRYTGIALPSYRDDAWGVESRLALLSHALEVLGGPSAVDEIVAELADSYSLQAATMRTGQSASTTTRPTEAMHQLRNAWRDLAHAKVVAEPVPDDLATLDRRHQVRLRLAGGPVQECVAHQISVLELAAYVTAAERSSTARALHTLIRESAAARREAPTILNQALLTERAITQVWRWRLGAIEDVPEDAT